MNLRTLLPVAAAFGVSVLLGACSSAPKTVQSDGHSTQRVRMAAVQEAPRARPRSRRRSDCRVAAPLRGRRARSGARPPRAGQGVIRPRGRRPVEIAVRRANGSAHPSALRSADRADQRARDHRARAGRRIRREEAGAGLHRRAARDFDVRPARADDRHPERRSRPTWPTRRTTWISR